MKVSLQSMFLFILLVMLTGCFSWIRAYQTYLQMDDFDQNFSISVENQFTVNFKDPRLYSEDFVSLSKLQPSEITMNGLGENWRYIFRKIDQQGQVVQPEIIFYFDLQFNQQNKLIQWGFSPLFLEIAPPEFLEVSLRSLAGAEINKGKRQLKANFEQLEKTSAALPQKLKIVNKLGEPLRIKDKKILEKYRYHFQLESKEVEKGYEDRLLSVIKLTFDKGNGQLLKLAGRFAGLKISIDYRKYRSNHQNKQLVQLLGQGVYGG